MVYLLSGEYGRIWQKERDEWYKNVFVPQADQADLEFRKKKIRKEARAAKKAAQLNAEERKQRRAKELEAKAKAKAEEYEKLKERVRKLAAPKMPLRTPKKKKEGKIKLSDEKAPTSTNAGCECSGHAENESKEEANPAKTEYEPETARTETPRNETALTETSNQPCMMCDGYVEQLQEIHKENCKKNVSGEEGNEGQEKATEAQ